MKKGRAIKELWDRWFREKKKMGGETKAGIERSTGKGYKINNQKTLIR